MRRFARFWRHPYRLAVNSVITPKLMKRFGVTWPEPLSCEKFPLFGEEICVGENTTSSDGHGIPTEKPDLTDITIEASDVPISFPESSFPLTSGSGYERLWDKAFQITGFLLFRLNCAGVNV